MNIIQQKTHEFLQKNHFINIEVPSDGNCFFHSLQIYFMLNCIIKSSKIFYKNFTGIPPVENTFQYNQAFGQKTTDLRNQIFRFIRDNEEIQNLLCLYGGYENSVLLMKEVNELNKDTKYEIPLFDLFPIIVATLYKVNICIYQVDIINDYTDCVFREPQIYKSFNNEEEGLTINLLYINGIHYELLYPDTILFQ